MTMAMSKADFMGMSAAELLRWCADGLGPDDIHRCCENLRVALDADTDVCAFNQLADRINSEQAGMVALPKDADGEVWHPGDVCDWGYPVGLHLCCGEDGRGKNGVDWYIENPGKVYQRADNCRHARTPAERIRAWVEREKTSCVYSDHLDDLLALADELGGEEG